MMIDTSNRATVSRWASLAMCAAVVLLASTSYLSHIQETIYNNDWLHTMGWGFPLGGNHPLIEQFALAAEANCRAVEASSELERKGCLAYQHVTRQQTYFSHPFYGLFGSLLQTTDLNVTPLQFAKAIQNSLVSAGIAGLAASLLVIIIVLACLDTYSRFLVASFATVVLLSDYGRRSDFIDIVHGGTSWVEGAILLGLAAAIIAALWKGVLSNDTRSTLRQLPYVEANETFLNSRGAFAIFIATPLLLALVLGTDNDVIAALAGIAGIGLLAWMGSATRLPAFITLIYALLILAASSGTVPSEFRYPRHEASIVAIVIFAAVTLKPRSAIAWFLPLALFFHIGTAIVVAFCIFNAELIISLWRRRPSHLLFASAATFTSGLIYSRFFWPKGLQSPESLPVAEFAATLAGSPLFWMGFVCAATISALALALLMKNSDRWSDIARACLMLAQIIGAAQIAAVLKSLADPGFDVSPGYFAFARLPDYLGPAVVCSIAASIALRPLPPLSENQPGDRPTGLNPLTLALVPLVAYAAMMPLNSISQIPTGIIQSAAQTYKYVIKGDLNEPFAKMAAKFRPDDDVYLLPDTPQGNHPIIYYSLLKLKIRISQNAAGSDIKVKTVPAN